MRRAVLGLVVLALAGLPAGCGDAGDASGRPALDVSAASSLQQALSEAASGFAPARVRLATGGSDQLAAQIRAGARPDVFAAANTRLPDALFREGLVERPVTFAGNELVIAVPAEGGTVRGVEDLSRPGLRLAVGSPSVPVGDYTAKVLARLGPAQRRAVEANVATREPDVAGVLAKLRAGAVDAGLVYRTDVDAAGGALRAVGLPASLRPAVTYAAAAVRGGDEPALARAYLDDLTGGRTQAALRRAGFLPAP